MDISDVLDMTFVEWGEEKGDRGAGGKGREGEQLPYNTRNIAERDRDNSEWSKKEEYKSVPGIK